ncbi:MAG: putative DNA-binding domain-containing protein [Polyangiales bacterium]
MSALEAFQRDFATVIFKRDYDAALARLGARADRFLAYRRMARSRLDDICVGTFARSRVLIGERWGELIARFFDEAPPTSVFIRDVPGQLCAWLTSDGARDALSSSPPWVLDLMRLEWAQAEASFLHDEQGSEATHEGARAGDVVALSFDRPAVLTPARRMLEVSWSVQDVDGPLDPESPPHVPNDRASLLVYRDAASGEVGTLVLSAFLAALVDEIDRAPQPLVSAIRAAAEHTEIPVDEALVVSLSSVLEDWMQRGIWLGSRR